MRDQEMFAAQKAKILETCYKPAPRLEVVAQEAQLILEFSRYQQETNWSRIKLNAKAPSINGMNG